MLNEVRSSRAVIRISTMKFLHKSKITPIWVLAFSVIFKYFCNVKTDSEKNEKKTPFGV